MSTTLLLLLMSLAITLALLLLLHSKPSRKLKHGVKLALQITLLLSVFALSFSLMVYSRNVLEQPHADSDMSNRISRISESLAKASSELSAIQTELESRIELVENLKAQSEEAEKVLSITDEQIAAMQSALSQELEKSNQRGFLIDLIISACFFVLGYIVNSLGKMVSKHR